MDWVSEGGSDDALCSKKIDEAVRPEREGNVGDGAGRLKSRANKLDLINSRDGGSGGGELLRDGVEWGNATPGESTSVGNEDAQMVVGLSGRRGMGTCVKNTLE